MTSFPHRQRDDRCLKNLHPYPAPVCPDRAKPGEWPSLEPLFDQLEQQLTDASDAAQLEQAILNWEELSAALAEEGSKRYIAMTCQTEDKAAETAYLEFVEKIEPEEKQRNFRLAKALTEHPHRAGLDARRYEVFTRDTALEVELFRSENVALETETTKLGQQYQKVIGGLTVQFDGEERTLVQMGRYLEETDRDRRREAWELVANRRLEEAETIDGQLDELAGLRNQMSDNAGFSNYRDYAHQRRGRFDYSPVDCIAFQDAIEQEMVPLFRELHDERRAALGIDSVKPWDTATDPQGRPPLKPFEEVADLVSRSQLIFNQGSTASWPAGSRQCRTSTCSTSPTAKARRRAATSARSTRRGCRLFS